MRLNKDKLALVATLAICAGRTTNAESAADQLQPLVEISAQRLVIVEQAALAKMGQWSASRNPSRDELIMLSHEETDGGICIALRLLQKRGGVLSKPPIP